MKEKIREVLEEEEIISEEQNGFRINRRATENIYIINEIIEDAKKNNKEIYCAFLDIEKAYDTVDRDILWEILEKIGLTEHIRKIIKSMYRCTVATYNWNGIEIKGVKSNRGLRQGCTLSPLLFTLIMEELVQRVKKVGVGVPIDQDKLCILTFADDIVLMAETMEDMQKMLDEIGEFSSDIKLNFEVDKSKVMIINREMQNGEKCELMGKALGMVDEYKYLGLTIDKTGLMKEKNGIRKKAEKMYGIINGKINCRANKYEVVRGLWKGLAVPTVMYGMEVIESGKKEEKGLEIVQNRAARRGLGANKHVATEALRGEMG